MPTYYPPGKRRGHPFIVVRGWIDGDQHEVRTNSLSKKGERGAEAYWENYKRGVRAERGAAPTRETATFDDAVALYRQNRDLSVNEGIKRLEKHFAGHLLASISLADLHSAAHCLYPGCKPQTKNRQALRPAGAILHYAAKNELCDWMCIECFEERDPPRPLVYPEELEVLIEAAWAQGDLELKALLTTFQRQGWRVTETLRIERARIDWRRQLVERWVTKSKKWRKAAVDAAVLPLWSRLDKREDGRLFSYKDRHEVYRAVDALETGLHFRPHMARRGFATALKDEGADLDDIMRSGGWDDPKSVRVYIRDDVERNRQIISRIGARLGAKRKSARKVNG